MRSCLRIPAPLLYVLCGFVVAMAVALFPTKLSAATVAYWQFEEGPVNTGASGAYAIYDSSGNGLHGTPYGNPIYRSESTPVGALGLEFNAAATPRQGVQVSDNPLFDLPQSLTLEAFIRLDSYPNNPANHGQILFRGDDAGGDDPYDLSIRGTTGELRFLVDDGTSSAYLFSPNPIPLNTLLHVAGTLDDVTGEMKLYIDGQEVASTVTSIRATVPLISGNPRVAIGNLGTGTQNDQVFPGFIDEVRISDKALAPVDFVGALRPGDTDGDSDVDTADLTTSFQNFTGAGGTGKTRAEGDNDGDGDVDTADLTAAYQYFTGTIEANLIYDPANGNVKLDASEAPGDVITQFSLTNAAGGLGFSTGVANFPFGGPVLTDLSTEISNFDTTTTGFFGTWNLGDIFPTGLDEAGLASFLTSATYGGQAGTGSSRPFDLMVVSTVTSVPEPGSAALLSLGLFGLAICGLYCRRRQRAVLVPQRVVSPKPRAIR